MSAQESTFLDGLNLNQRAAVAHGEGPLLVLAGAGSGKTRVITRRIAHLIAMGSADASEILALTFTNKAAGEMRERVGALAGKKQAAAVSLGTFHAYCLQVLREHIEHLGYRRNFTIASESDARTLLRRAVEDLGTRDKRFSPAQFQAIISLHKNANGNGGPPKPGPVRTATEEKYQEYLTPIYDQYQSALRAANALDFDDLLVLTLQLWRDHEAIYRQCRDRFRYVLVDEYQDTNRLQFDLLRMLVAGRENLCAVGDDDQSIYAWRGADPRNIGEFENQFSGAKVIALEQNYRSVQTILSAANAVIANNSGRHPKKLWSKLGEGRSIDWLVTADEEAEAKEAVKWLRYIQSKTGARYSDFALLYRSNIQSRPLEIAFRQAGIPYIVIGGQDFFERTEVRDIVSYLKALANPRDEAALLRIVNMPRRGIGDTTLHKVHDLCRQEGMSFTKGLETLLHRGLGSAANQRQTEQGIRQFLGLLKKFRERLRGRSESLREIVEALVLELDYRGELERVSKTPAQLEHRWQNVELVLDAIGTYEESAGAPTLAGFLDESHLAGDQGMFDKDERRRNGVTLMTVHSAKGLEFPFVFIMGIEEGLLPHEKSLKESSLEEERRLFYVALTRAQRHVTLFEALTRSRNGKERNTKTSRFAHEIPAEYVNKRFRAVPGTAP